MKTKIFDSYSDPGHGWLKAPRKLIVQLGIGKEISHYSYQRGDFVYLEEDCDLSLFWKALNKHGIEIKMRHHTADRTSKIRGYASYAPHIND